ncbi:MAG TPA: PAS domain-containing protein, partial [Gammaproteobacteria bacterium]
MTQATAVKHKRSLLRRVTSALTGSTDKRTPPHQAEPATINQQIDILTNQLKSQELQLRRKTQLLQRTTWELNRAYEKYAELYELTPVGYFNLSRKGIVLNANNRAATLLNWDVEQIIGKPLSNFVHHGSLSTYYEFITNPKILRPPSVCELKFVRQRGLPFDALMEVCFRRNKHGAITEIMVLLSDNTESKEYENAMFAEMDRAQVTLHSIGDGVITTDTDGIIDYMNPVAENLTGWSTQTAIGKRLQSVFQVVNANSNQ